MLFKNSIIIYRRTKYIYISVVIFFLYTHYVCISVTAMHVSCNNTQQHTIRKISSELKRIKNIEEEEKYQQQQCNAMQCDAITKQKEQLKPREREKTGRTYNKYMQATG